MLTKPCFRLCGICPEQKLEKRPTASNAHEETDLQQLRDLRANTHKAITDPHAITGAHFAHTNGRQRLCVYTDGSCILPRHRKLAHAGWGVAFSLHAEEWGDCGPLKSGVQTSYRAEVRAIAHALARTKTPTLICSDCKAAVTTLQNYLRTGRRPANPSELWTFIFNTVDLLPDYFDIRWVPAHLGDDPSDQEEMHRLINNNVTTLEHVRGNVYADLLARRGTLGHDLCASEVVLAQERAALTALVQTHLVKSWAEWITRHGNRHDEPLINAIREVPDDMDAVWDAEDGLDPAYDYEDLPPELLDPDDLHQPWDEDMIDLDGNPLWEPPQPTQPNTTKTNPTSSPRPVLDDIDLDRQRLKQATTRTNNNADADPTPTPTPTPPPTSTPHNRPHADPDADHSCAHANAYADAPRPPQHQPPTMRCFDDIKLDRRRLGYTSSSGSVDGNNSAQTLIAADLVRPTLGVACEEEQRKLQLPSLTGLYAQQAASTSTQNQGSPVLAPAESNAEPPATHTEVQPSSPTLPARNGDNPTDSTNPTTNNLSHPDSTPTNQPMEIDAPWAVPFSEYPEHRTQWDREEYCHVKVKQVPISNLPAGLTPLDMDAVCWWLEHTPWAKISDAGPPAHAQCSYVEAAVDLELVTGVKLGGDSASLDRTAELLCAALRRIWHNKNASTNGIQQTHAQGIRPRATSAALHACGTWLPGFDTRPSFLHGRLAESIILTNLVGARKSIARQNGDDAAAPKLQQRKKFGNWACRMPPNRPTPSWSPPALRQIQNALHIRRAACTPHPHANTSDSASQQQPQQQQQQ